MDGGWEGDEEDAQGRNLEQTSLKLERRNERLVAEGG